MKCLRCGLCCTKYMVIIVKPEAVERGFKSTDDLSNDDLMCHEGNKEECPHLIWDENIAICKIHEYPWYEETPCSSHGQIEKSKDCVCRMGEYILKKNITIKRS